MGESNIVKTFTQYRRTLEQYIRGLVKNQDIEDIVQETFVRSFEAELSHDIQYARTYMLRTAKHIALNHNQKWDNKYSASLEDLADGEIDPAVESKLKSRSLEAEAASREQFFFFCEAVDQLQGNVQHAFVLKKVYGLSQKEIAANLGISESTVEKHVAKGIRHCADYIQKIKQPTVTAGKKVIPAHA
ncbi:MAG: sigma-70 family RNA polymerase sigma factor [Pseudomonadales bacterium]|nr:sigma-70 family RNA polymerase sigma factor [Pseudomonadales bacterium]